MQNKRNNRAIVVFSGGQDSTTCLFWALKKFDKVIAIAFDYGQKHKLELQCGEKICKDNDIEFHVLDMSLLNQLASNSLTRKNMTVDKEQKDGELPNSFVDGRNLVFLTFAAIFAKQHNIDNIVTGVSQSDFSGYPDCRDIFVKSTNVTLNLAMDYQFVIHTPLMWIDKRDTWKMAYDLGVIDIIKNNTLTCYNGIIGDGCGECPSCTLRRKGYEEFEKKYLNKY